MSRPTPDTAFYCLLSRTGLSPSPAGFPKTVLLGYLQIPRSIPQCARTLVWALPISLAATLGIDVSFSSSGYLDVSVHRVPFVTLCIHVTMTALNDRRVSPFRDLRINGYLLLPEAFRSLSRLSSALSAKASTLRSSSFDLFIRMRLRMGLKMISHLAVQCVYIVLIRYL